MLRLCKQVASSLILITLGLIITGCGFGGSGGGGAFDGNPGFATIEVSPRKIDSGDRFTVTVRIFDIQRNEFPGLLVKVLHPSSLRYLLNSAFLTLPNEVETDFEPRKVNADESGYLLFYIDTNDVDPNNRTVTIEFIVRGVGTVLDGAIAVDLDAVSVDNRGRFDATDPKFTALTSTTVTVTG